MSRPRAQTDVPPRARRPSSEAEPRRPPEHCLRQLDEAARELRPDDPSLAEWFQRYRAEHRRRLAMDLHLLERFAPAPGPGGAPLEILELGAVPLLLTAALASTRHRVQGLDVAPERFASSIEALGLRVAKCDVETEPMPFDDASFDVVLCNELFEHLRHDLLFTLGEIRRVLRHGGMLFLSTPNLRSLRGLKNLLLHHRAHAVSGGVYEQWQKLRTLGHMGHVREYTVREVIEVLERMDLPVERVVYRGGHGRGPVGLVERLAPGLRPFFTVLARRRDARRDDTKTGSAPTP